MLNKITLIGNLGRDPEAGYTNNGKNYCRFSVATKEYGGETEWFNVTAWGKTAEFVTQYLGKGSKVYVEGSMRSRKYENKEGVEVTAWSVSAQKVLSIGSKGDSKPVNSDPTGDWD